MPSSGIAAQHGRKGHEAVFSDPYVDPLEAYYSSGAPDVTGFSDATKAGEPLKRGRYAKGRVDPAPVAYPY